jgi:RHS repeat-associated protein
VSSTQLVQVSNKINDGYRFGYNGQEKVDEIAGIGNHYTFRFREYDPRTGRFWSFDPLAKKYPWNSPYAFAEGDVIRAIDLEGLEKLIVIGGADLQNTGLAKTTLQTASDMQKFSDAHHLNYDVKVYNTGPTNASFMDAFKYIKDNYKKDEPIILYGYSMGGVGVNQLAKQLKSAGIKVNLMVNVDAAFGLMSKPLEVPDNVKTDVNFYQTSRSNFPVYSRGYKAKPQEGNNSTQILNYNMDGKTEKAGSDAHGSMDESTQKDAEGFMQYEMMGKLDGYLKDSKQQTAQPATQSTTGGH